MGRRDRAGASLDNAATGTNRHADLMAKIEQLDSKVSDLESTSRAEQERMQVAAAGLLRDAGLTDFKLCLRGAFLFAVGWLAHVDREFFILLTWILPPTAIYHGLVKELKDNRRTLQTQTDKGRVWIEDIKLKFLGYVAPVIAGALFSINPELMKLVSWVLSPYAVFRGLFR